MRLKGSVLNLFPSEFTTAHFHHYFLTSLESRPITTSSLDFTLKWRLENQTLFLSILEFHTLYTNEDFCWVWVRDLPAASSFSEFIHWIDGHTDHHLSSAFKAWTFVAFCMKTRIVLSFLSLNFRAKIRISAKALDFSFIGDFS